MFKYSINLEWSDEDKSYIATVPELPGLSAFGETPEKTVKEIKIAAKGYLEVLKEDGDDIPEPILKRKFSGQTRLRMPTSLHESLAMEASKEGISLNTYLITLLADRDASKRIESRLYNIEKYIDESKNERTQTGSKMTQIFKKEDWDDTPINYGEVH